MVICRWAEHQLLVLATRSLGVVACELLIHRSDTQPIEVVILFRLSLGFDLRFQVLGEQVWRCVLKILRDGDIFFYSPELFLLLGLPFFCLDFSLKLLEDSQLCSPAIHCHSSTTLLILIRPSGMLSAREDMRVASRATSRREAQKPCARSPTRSCTLNLTEGWSSRIVTLTS